MELSLGLVTWKDWEYLTNLQEVLRSDSCMSWVSWGYFEHYGQRDSAIEIHFAFLQICHKLLCILVFYGFEYVFVDFLDSFEYFSIDGIMGLHGVSV